MITDDSRSAGDANFTTDLASLMPRVDFSRRQALVTTLATGFALATQPVCAQTAISTGTDGLEAGEVKIPTADVEIPAYRAMPAGAGPFPVILVVQEIFGVHEYIKDVCRRLAREGYMAIAPQMYARQGDVLALSNIDDIRKIVAKVPDAQVMSDLDAAVAFAKASGNANTDQLGITGFCWGGCVTWRYSAHNPNVKAGVAWYGRLVGEKGDLTPKHPVDVAADLKAPILGLYGSEDQGIPVDTVEKMRAACSAASKTCEIVVYPGAPHAFHADYRPSYRAEPAKDGWTRLLAWFKQHGLAPAKP
jgi:carboxymethylenebutenolidase